MKILVLGSNGQLGRCLNDQLKNSDNEVFFASRKQIDISNFELTNNQLLEISPEIIINATAYTAVDKAEFDREAANLINHLAVKNIANICNQQNWRLIHISTDYVFDGSSSQPYSEKNQANPKGVYGNTKLKGELAVQSSGCKHTIIRTSWVFSEYGNNFLKTMLKVGAEKDELRIVDDQIGCPTYAQDLAKSILSLIYKLSLKEDLSGVYHYCGNEPCTWYDFAEVIFYEANLLNCPTPKSLIRTKTIDYPTPAFRPPYSVMDCSKINSCFGINCSDWKLGVKNALQRLI